MFYQFFDISAFPITFVHYGVVEFKDVNVDGYFPLLRVIGCAPNLFLCSFKKAVNAVNVIIRCYAAQAVEKAFGVLHTHRFCSYRRGKAYGFKMFL